MTNDFATAGRPLRLNNAFSQDAAAFPHHKDRLFVSGEIMMAKDFVGVAAATRCQQAAIKQSKRPVNFFIIFFFKKPGLKYER